LSGASQIAFLGRRAFLRSVRQPGQLAFALIFPLFFLFVVSHGLNPAASLPGFPADSYVDFMFAIPFVHGALFTALNSAIELGRDIDTGFLNRLALTPARGIAIMLGRSRREIRRQFQAPVPQACLFRCKTEIHAASILT